MKEGSMNPTLYEGLASQHLADLHRESSGSNMVARARDEGQVAGGGRRLDLHRGIDRLATIMRAVRLRVRARATRASA
jgi:hypothetical protein